MHSHNTVCDNYSRFVSVGPKQVRLPKKKRAYFIQLVQTDCMPKLIILPWFYGLKLSFVLDVRSPVPEFNTQIHGVQS